MDMIVTQEPASERRPRRKLAPTSKVREQSPYGRSKRKPIDESPSFKPNRSKRGHVNVPYDDQAVLASEQSGSAAGKLRHIVKDSVPFPQPEQSNLDTSVVNDFSGGASNASNSEEDSDHIDDERFKHLRDSIENINSYVEKKCQVLATKIKTLKEHQYAKKELLQDIEKLKNDAKTLGLERSLEDEARKLEFNATKSIEDSARQQTLLEGHFKWLKQFRSHSNSLSNFTGTRYP